MNKQAFKIVAASALFGMALALASCANSTSSGSSSSGGGGGGGSSSIADNPDTRYFGISGDGAGNGSSGTGGTSTGSSGGTGTGGSTTPAPSPTPTPTGRIGTKASPNAVGDIVFSDGSATAYNDASFDFAAHQSDAVAVIFDAVSKKGIGLACCQKIWTTHLLNAALGIDGMSRTDGSGNYTILYNKATTQNVGTRFPIAPADMATVFPVMYWVHTYSVPGYTSGWYLPAKNELALILQNVTELEQALSKVNGFTIGNKRFWTSNKSFSTTGNAGVYYEYYDYSNNNVQTFSTEDYDTYLYYGIPVHVFN